MKPLDHWGKAARQWHKVGQPLKPTTEDIRALELFIRHSNVARPRVLLLGVTPEIAAMDWPAGTRLLAVDRSIDMIKYAWAGANAAEVYVACADWCELPLADSSRDIIVGDGCMLVFDYPHGFRRALESFRRVLTPGGLLSHRFFLRPEQGEPPAAVFDDLFAGRIKNFHVFKWRLAMWLHGDIEDGVRLGDVWDCWHDAVPDANALSESLNWQLETISSIDYYRDSDTRFIFPTLEEVRRARLPYFKEVRCYVPKYECGERFQTLLFEAL
ncbi:MAG: class I SAM-dependent methyltransferase [Proteobacteria bacterium]|nr:class I SAM-dependent methyltransferase [Pseudomonadota bacterium]MDA1357628.1 class I SAM-dependent methyltransferase [Pseudomonadota bacterium]